MRAPFKICSSSRDSVTIAVIALMAPSRDTAFWRSAFSLLQDHPITGVGVGAYGHAVREVRDPQLARDQIATAHNVYLNTGAEMGVIGLLAGAWLLLTLIVTWWKKWKATSAGSASWWRFLGVGAALAGLAAQMMVETYTEPAVLLPAIFFIAFIVAPDPNELQSKSRGKRLPWVMALILLIAGSVGKAWDTWAYAEFSQSVAAIQQEPCLACLD